MPAQARGTLVALEGGEGSGKSTQAARLAGWLRAGGHEVCLTAEPGGTPLGELVKRVFQRPLEHRLNARAELLLFEAARADHVERVIRPALAAGRIVLCDRFTDSSIAYQGHGRGLPVEEVRRCSEVATGGLSPDFTLLFDVPPETGLGRADAGDDRAPDYIGRESLEFHRRVREGFLELAKAGGEQRYAVIDASAPEQQVYDNALQAVTRLLERVPTPRQERP